MELIKIRQTLRTLLANRRVQFAARLILGGVFIYAGLTKIAAPREFAGIVVNYQVLPEKAAIYFAYLLPWVEIILGTLMVLGLGVKKTALALSFLLVAFIGAVLIRYMNGSTAPCGCFSLKSLGPESIFLTIGRDVGLLACGVHLFFYHGN